MNQIETGLTWLAPFLNKILVFFDELLLPFSKVDTIIMVSKKLPVIGLQVAVVFGTQKAALVTK